MDPEAPKRHGPPKKQFPFDDSYDFSYRPATYWPELPTERTLLSKIKGTQRRDIARRALEGEELQRLGGDDLYREAMEFALEESLEDEERESWGRIHPAMMGGEYLPADLEDEIEVARIELASVTGDVIQLRARPSNGRILYRVVDEYWDEGSRYTVSPEESGEPLSFGELIELLDTARQADEGHLHENDAYNVGLADKDRAANYDEGSDAEGLIYFATVSSLYYPQLASYYRDRARTWYEQILLDQLDDEVSTALLVSRRDPVRPVSPADYGAEMLLLPSRRGAPNRVEAVVDKVALERWMRYVAGLDGFELCGSYQREALWVGRLVRVEARWRHEGSDERVVELENRVSALLPLVHQTPAGQQLLDRDLDDPAIPVRDRLDLALAMGRRREADTLLLELSADDPFEAAEFLSQLDRQAEALDLYRAAADEQPAEVAWRLFRAGRLAEAEPLFQRAGDQPDAILGLAAASRRRGDTADAIALFEQWRTAGLG